VRCVSGGGRVFDINQSEPLRWMFPAEPSFFVDPRGALELKDGEGIGGMKGPEIG
jgi:hypothetical protein